MTDEPPNFLERWNNLMTKLLWQQENGLFYRWDYGYNDCIDWETLRVTQSKQHLISHLPQP